MKIKHDIIVVGSGPGGALTANILKENGHDLILIDSGAFYNILNTDHYSIMEMEKKYKFGGITPTYGNPKITYVEGECVGGGSEINSGLYHRLPDDILNNWVKDYHVKNLSNSDLNEHYNQIEKDITVSYYPNDNDIPKASKKLHEGAQKLGWESKEIPRWFKYDNYGQSGIKQSMTETYLAHYIKNDGKVYSNTKALKIEKNKKGWRIICLNKEDGNKIILDANYVFLCAGSINTPFLLRNSGFKNNIGNSLKVHPTIKVIAKFSEKINSDTMGVPVHQVKEFSPQYSFGCSISTKPYLALGLIDYSEQLDKLEEEIFNLATYYAMIVPEGRGTIRKIPFFNDPFVSYSLKNADLKLLSVALSNLSLLLFEAGAESIFPSISNYECLNEKNDIKKIPKILSRKDTNLMTIHLFSSCPMGENKSKCAADSYGKLHGESNLFINDGSLLCSAPGVNPQGGIMAIARRNVFHFMNNIIK